MARQTLPLSLVSAGEIVEFVDIQGHGMLRQRLAEMGLTPGTVIRVVQSNPSGPMILAIRQDTRLAIGRSAAHRVMVCFTGER
ncbi:MAG: ferrous iron transport protein A [Anaerolineae bacterium]|nr:ferrous iron transport protein A [Anaerolineae bacterium]